jgi:hypothetical protein
MASHLEKNFPRRLFFRAAYLTFKRFVPCIGILQSVTFRYFPMMGCFPATCTNTTARFKNMALVDNRGVFMYFPAAVFAYPAFPIMFFIARFSNNAAFPTNALIPVVSGIIFV